MAVVSRLELNHPALGSAGGSSLHTSIEALYEKIGDAVNGRWFAITDFDQGETVDLNHNFSTDQGNLQVDLLNFVGGKWVKLTDLTSPSTADFTIVEKSGDEKDVLQITNDSGGDDLTFAVTMSFQPIYISDGDIKDVNATSPEDGQALVFDDATKKWVAGASGDASFKLQDIVGQDLTVKSGYIILSDGRELRTDAAADLTVDLSGYADATYYFYIDLEALGASVVVDGRTLYNVEAGDVVALTDLPTSVDLQRYLPLGGATKSTTWSDLFSSGFRRHQTAEPLKLKTITNADSPYTASIGEWLLADTSGGAITVNMPALGTLAAAKEEFSYIKVSDCASNWHVNAVTLVPFSGESIDSQAADETLVLDVEAQNVCLVRSSSSNWCVDTNFQPIEDTGGGSGVGELNFTENPDFNGTAGTTGWASTGDFSAVSLDTSTQLEGDASLTWTNNYTSTRGTIEGNINTVDLAYRGLSAEASAVLRVVGTGGVYHTYLTDDGVKVDATETIIDATGGGTFYPKAFGFVYDASVYKYVVLDVSGTNTDVLTLDLVKNTTDGAGALPAGARQYDDTEVGLSNTPPGWNLHRAVFTPYRLSNGDWRLNFNISAGITGTTGDTVDIDGIVTPNISSYFQTCTIIGDNTSREAGRAVISPNDNTINFSFPTSYNLFVIEGDIELASKPTWADDIPLIGLSKGAVLQNSQDNHLSQDNATALAIGSNKYIPDNITLEKGFTYDAINDYIIPELSGQIMVSGSLRLGSGTSNFGLQITDGTTTKSFANLQNDGISVELKVQGACVFSITAGTPFWFTTYSLIANTFGGGPGSNFIDFFFIPKDTGNLPTGAGTSVMADDKARYLVPRYQTVTIDVSSSGDFSASNASMTFIRIGNLVTYSTDTFISHTSTNAPNSATGLVPVEFRPTSNMYNTYFYNNTNAFSCKIESNGTIGMDYQYEAGGVNRPNSGLPISGSYIII